MSLRPDDRGAKRERSRTRDRSRSRYDDDDQEPSKSSKSKARPRQRDDDDDEPPKTSAKSKSRSRYADDDDDDDQEPARGSKSKSRARFDDDDDDDDAPRNSASKSKSKSKSRYDDDDDNGDDQQARRSKVKSRARFDDEEEDDLPNSRSKPKSRSRYDDDDAEELPKTSSKARRSLRFQEDDDGRSSATMPTMPGAFDDDDDAALAYGPPRQSGARMPGFSVLGSNSMGPEEDSDSPRTNRRDKRSSKSGRQYESDVRSPTDSRASFFDQGRVRSPKDPRASFFDPDERIDERPRPRKSASAHGRVDSGASMPYPETDHAFMPSMPSIPGGDMDYGMVLPYGAERPYDYDDDDDDRHLAYTAKPLTRSRTDDVEESSRPRPKSPSRSASFPQPALEVREPQSRRKSSNLLSVQGSKDAGLSPASKSRNGRLSVSTDRPNASVLGRPPASPLLEAYHGTYQTASPMPSPMMLPNDSAIEDLDELEAFSLEERKPSEEGSVVSRKSIDPKTGKKRVVLYDSEGDAEKLAKALNRHEARPGPLVDILPGLTHDQLLALREQYKKRVKVAGRGVNLSKQIKAGTAGNFGKVAYVTSLGRWEAEAYWANFWYQAHSSNRELLIEALMGKPNAEVREINGSFKDKRYQDSLSLCMEKELKPDKFRTAVLTALEARRQEETDVWPLEYRNQDVEVLHRALKGREGGESAILDVVVRRSDNHLRELLKTYERVHEENFARAALMKSNNLVGEVIAHILNGVINRPARDCLLLRHAIKDVTSKNKEVELRYELLMSRLIRLHWDRTHLVRVKSEYRNKYGEELERSIKAASHGDFGDFCVKLCET